MKRFIVLLLVGALPAVTAGAQELYVNTEPASNMAAHSLGIRVENQGYFKPGFHSRSTLELMYGANKNLMLHGSVYTSDYYTDKYHFEGGSAYAKYRFLSVDSVQRHFRGAAFIKAAAINNPLVNREISLEGDNSGVQTGVVFTKLLHKLALSGSASYIRALNNTRYNIPARFAHDAAAWSLSAGYLVLPKNYRGYKQVNVNLYLELLGKANPGYGQSYMDAAPAIQFIFNSTTRLDLSYRAPLWNDMQRNTKNMYLVRIEYNLFNIF